MAGAIDMATQLGTSALRLGWYYGINQLVDAEVRRRGSPPAYRPVRPVPSRQHLFRDLAALTLADAAAVRDGRLPASEDGLLGLPAHLARLRAMLADLPSAVDRRREADTGTARAAAGRDLARDPLPDYFVQDFHFQSGGYLTEQSARLYDVQVETLFYGSAQLMRRVGLEAIHRHIAGRDQRELSLVDVACGTGAFLREVRRAYPAMRLSGLDLSATYLDEARRAWGRLRPADWIAANAETIPLPDASQDLVTTIFLFHELPPAVRHRVTREFARVLKPGGLLVFTDSLQLGDKPDWDGLIEAFPVRFHEPYYRHYAIDDFDRMFAVAGLAAVESRLAFLAKVMVRRKL